MEIGLNNHNSRVHRFLLRFKELLTDGELKSEFMKLF